MSAKKKDNSSSETLFDLINHHIIPPVFVVFFVIATQFLAWRGNPSQPFELGFVVGNTFAWKVIGSIFLWAFLWLWCPSKKFHGSTTSFGYTPVYQANGEIYYIASIAAVLLASYMNPQLCVDIYFNMGAILGGLNIVALCLCTYMLLHAKMKSDEKDPYLLKNSYPFMFEFYRGMELHPRILGVDVKQVTNCRIGMISWQLLIIIFFMAGWQLHGFNTGHLVNVLLQTIYIYKFFRWETGYFNTLDITLDRAGYYLCWGCLVWIHSFYTFHSYFFVHHEPNCSTLTNFLLFGLGLLSIWYNYDVDRQKELFRTAGGKPVEIWGKRAESLKVTYKTADGKTKESTLLLSGWWGVARKINYTFELLAALIWCSPAALDYGVWPFLYFIFLLILLIHRIYRDELKCKEKYGKGWDEYCQRVKYRLLPYIY